MANTEYNFKALDKVLNMDSSALAHEFLIKKTPEEIRAYDAEIKKLPEDQRKRVVDPFVTSSTILTEFQDLVRNNRELFPTVSSIQNLDFAYLIQVVHEKYRLIVRNPRKYKINYEVILMYYDELLSMNWETFDSERLYIIDYFKKLGQTKRTRTPQVNADIVNKLVDIISSIDLSKVETLGY